MISEELAVFVDKFHEILGWLGFGTGNDQQSFGDDLQWIG